MDLKGYKSIRDSKFLKAAQNNLKLIPYIFNTLNKILTFGILHNSCKISKNVRKTFEKYLGIFIATLFWIQASMDLRPPIRETQGVFDAW